MATPLNCFSTPGAVCYTVNLSPSLPCSPGTIASYYTDSTQVYSYPDDSKTETVNLICSYYSLEIILQPIRCLSSLQLRSCHINLFRLHFSDILILVRVNRPLKSQVRMCFQIKQPLYFKNWKLKLNQKTIQSFQKRHLYLLPQLIRFGIYIRYKQV